MGDKTRLEIGVDAVLGRLPDDKRQALQDLREVIRAAARPLVSHEGLLAVQVHARLAEIDGR